MLTECTGSATQPGSTTKMWRKRRMCGFDSSNGMLEQARQRLGDGADLQVADLGRRARSFTAISEWAADAPPRVLAVLGVRYEPLARRFQPPDEATIRRVLESVDAAALETAVGSWLAARLQAARPAPFGAGPRERRAVAVDGKAVRGTRQASGNGQAVHLLATAEQHSAAVLAQPRWARPGMTPNATMPEPWVS
jgi:hypothetical protein